MSRPPAPDPDRPNLSRRSFLKGAGGAAAAGGVLSGMAGASAPTAVQEDGAPRLSGEVPIELSINGEQLKLTVEPRTTLLSALRTRLEPPLTGTKEVCARGSCGACTVIVDGLPVYACLQLAVTCAGKEIRTIEGLGSPEAMSPVQEAFCAHDAVMCGFCTPGFVVATTSALERHPGADRALLERELSGNLCRCGTYPQVMAAALAARDAQRRSQGASR